MAVWARMSYFQGYAEMWTILLTRSKCARVWKLKVWGMKRAWFGYDSRSTIQHTVSDLDRSYNGQSAPEAGRCKRYRLPQWSYSGQSAPKLSSTYLSAHGSQTAGMEGGMAQRAPKGSMKQVSRPMISKQQPSTSPQKWSSFWGFASGYASGLCFGVCFGGMLRKSATFHQYISRTTEKILTHIYIYIMVTIIVMITPKML